MTVLFFISVLAVGGPQDRLNHVPPPLEAKDCKAAAASDELPNARFERKGGRTTRLKVRLEGSALTVDGVAQGRNLGQYDRVELKNPGPMAGGVAQNNVIARARVFLWEHWRDRKRGYLIITLSSVDATSTSHVFVEPDDMGRWRVYWRIVRHTGEINDLPTYYSVEWVVPTGWMKPAVTPTLTQRPDPTKHALELRDKCGDVEQSF